MKPWLVATLIIAGAIALGAATYAIVTKRRTDRFINRVLMVEIREGESKSEVAAKLGRPSSIAFQQAFQEENTCSGANGAERWIYTHPDGGWSRLLYFDSNGKFLCDEQQMWHIWSSRGNAAQLHGAADAAGAGPAAKLPWAAQT